jgi:transcriptional regulator with XRE-family HTH domain
MNYKEDLAEMLKDPEFKKAYDQTAPEFELIKSMLELRHKRKLSQRALALKMNAKQPTLARLEREGYKRATIPVLKKIAAALDARLIIRMEPLSASKKLAHGRKA